MRGQVVTRPLQIQEPTGIDRRDWPVTGGIPFGQGELHSLDHMCIVDEQGRPLPAQVWELCRWPDGSIRWAGVHLPVSVPRQQCRELQLQFGDSVTGSQPAAAVHVDICEDEINIETETLELSIRKTPLQFSGRLRGGPPLIEPATRDGFWITDTSNKRYWAAVEAVEVEVNGPLYVLLRLTGTHVAADGTTLFDFMLRLHLFALAPWIEADYTFISGRNRLPGFLAAASLSDRPVRSIRLAARKRRGIHH